MGNFTQERCIATMAEMHPYTAKEILLRLKLSTNPFCPISHEIGEWENDTCCFREFRADEEVEHKVPYDEVSQLIPHTSDGFLDPYDTPEWVDTS